MSFFPQTLVFSLPFCFGILFSGFLLENGASSTTTAWIYNLYLVIYSLAMILSNALCQEFGQRTVGFISVFMMSLSVTLSGFTPSVFFVFFCFSLLGGKGSHPPCLDCLFSILFSTDRQQPQSNIVFLSPAS